MAHTYAAKNLNVKRTYCNPLTAGAYFADAIYISNTGTLAEVVAAISAAADAVEKLPVGSSVDVRNLTGGQLAQQHYLVSANTGSAITLTESKIA